MRGRLKNLWPVFWPPAIVGLTWLPMNYDERGSLLAPSWDTIIVIASVLSVMISFVAFFLLPLAVLSSLTKWHNAPVAQKPQEGRSLLGFVLALFLFLAITPIWGK